MKEFEYMEISFSKMVKPHYQQFDVVKLNELGKYGWEIVTVIGGTCIFKREVLK